MITISTITIITTIIITTTTTTILNTKITIHYARVFKPSTILFLADKMFLPGKKT